LNIATTPTVAQDVTTSENPRDKSNLVEADRKMRNKINQNKETLMLPLEIKHDLRGS